MLTLSSFILVDILLQPDIIKTMTQQLYVPLKDITPLLNSEGRPGVFIWQAFPWSKPLYTAFGEYMRKRVFAEFLCM